MPKITDIKPQQKNKSRVSIYLDGKFYCGLEKFTALSNRLKIGDEVCENELAEIQEESESGRAFEQAVGYIGRRKRSKKEIIDYLIKKGYLINVVDSVVEKLMSYHYIDDLQFCVAYLETHRHRLGEKRLVMDLRKFGIDSFTIEDAMEDFGEQSDEATRQAEKYIRTHSKADKRKLSNFLYSKGYNYDDIKTAIINTENLFVEDDEEDE